MSFHPRSQLTLPRLIEASPEGEDPVVLLQAAARDFIPIDPSNPSSLANVSASQGRLKTVPEPWERLSIEHLLHGIREQEWYSDQIAFSQTIDAKEAQLGGPTGRALYDRTNRWSLFTRRVGSTTVAANHARSTGRPEHLDFLYPPSLCYIRSEPGQTCHRVYEHCFRQKCHLPGSSLTSVDHGRDLITG